MEPILVHSYSDELPITNHVYLHGIIEKIEGTDFCYIPDIDDEFDGILNGTVNSRPVTIFLWHSESDGLRRGLVVSNADKHSLEYAQELYDNRE